MAVNLQDRLEKLRGKAQLLTQRYEDLCSEKQQADQQIRSLKDQLEKAEKENRLLRLKVEELQVVSTISPSRDNVEQTRQFLAELVRDIDKCINDLNE